MAAGALETANMCKVAEGRYLHIIRSAKILTVDAPAYAFGSASTKVATCRLRDTRTIVVTAAAAPSSVSVLARLVRLCAASASAVYNIGKDTKNDCDGR